MSNTVLIVDDAYFMRNLIKKALKEAGYEVIGEAKNGKEGIKLYFELKPDIVTMDINMPDISGIEATKQILSKDPYANIIAVTGNNDDAIKQEIIDAGVKEYLQKPFQPAFLLTKIEKMMEEPIEDAIADTTTQEQSKVVNDETTSIVVNAGDAPEDDLLEEIEIMSAPDKTKNMTIEVINDVDGFEFPEDYVETVVENQEENALTKEKIQEMENEELIELVDNKTLDIENTQEDLVIEISERKEERSPIIKPTPRAEMVEQTPTIQPKKTVYQPPEIKQPSKKNIATSTTPPAPLKEPNVSGVEITKSKIKDKKMHEINIRPTSYASTGKDEINIRPPRGKMLREDSDRFEDKDIEEPILNVPDKDNYNDKNNNGIFGIVKKIFKK